MFYQVIDNEIGKSYVGRFKNILASISINQ